MASMTIVAWERADESRGHSVALVEERLDGWLFHGSEVLVGDETLSCTFSVVVGTDWVTRHVEVIGRLGGRRDPSCPGRVGWALDRGRRRASRPRRLRRRRHRRDPADQHLPHPATGPPRGRGAARRLESRGSTSPRSASPGSTRPTSAWPTWTARPAGATATRSTAPSSSRSTRRDSSSTTKGSPDAYRLRAGRDDRVRPALPRRRVDVHQGGSRGRRRRGARHGRDAVDAPDRRPRRLPCAGRGARGRARHDEAGLFQRGRRAAARRRRVRAAGDRRGGLPRRAQRRRQSGPCRLGTARRERGEGRRPVASRLGPARRRYRRRQLGSVAAQRCSAGAGRTGPSGRGRGQRRCPGRRGGPAARRRSAGPSRGQRRPGDRRDQPRERPGRDPGHVPRPRHRREGPVEQPGLSRDGPRADAGLHAARRRGRPPTCSAPTSSSSTSVARPPTSTPWSPRKARTRPCARTSSAPSGTPAPSRATSVCGGTRSAWSRRPPANALPSGTGLHRYAATVAADPAHLPADDDEVALDLQLATVASLVAVRRHGRPARAGCVPLGRSVRSA